MSCHISFNKYYQMLSEYEEQNMLKKRGFPWNDENSAQKMEIIANICYFFFK